MYLRSAFFYRDCLHLVPNAYFRVRQMLVCHIIKNVMTSLKLILFSVKTYSLITMHDTSKENNNNNFLAETGR